MHNLTPFAYDLHLICIIEMKAVHEGIQINKYVVWYLPFSWFAML